MRANTLTKELLAFALYKVPSVKLVLCSSHTEADEQGAGDVREPCLSVLSAEKKKGGFPGCHFASAEDHCDGLTTWLFPMTLTLQPEDSARIKRFLVCPGLELQVREGYGADDSDRDASVREVCHDLKFYNY